MVAPGRTSQGIPLPIKKLAILGAIIATATIAPLACNFDQLTAEKVMVATVLSTPNVEIDPFAFAGFDFSTDGGCGTSDGGSACFDAGGFDASFPSDSGFSISDGGKVVVPGQTGAVIFFGERQSSLDQAPTPIEGATAKVSPEGSTEITLKEVGAGAYQLTSVDNGEFKYIDGATYRFTASKDGENFIGKVEKAPGRENIPEFHPAQGYRDHVRGQGFTFNRPEPPQGEERNLGFVTVFPVKDTGEKGNTTYTDLPSDALAFLKVLALPADWKKTVVTVPGTAFPDKDTTYVLVFQSVKIGGPESANLFTGSAILAGTADVAVFKVK